MCITLRIVAILTLTVTFVARTSAEPRAKVLFVGKQPDHPFGTHMYLHTGRVLSRCLAKSANIETIVSDGWPKDKEKLVGVKTIVVYSNPAAELLLDGPHRDEVRGMIQKGVGLVTIHWASSVYAKNLERLGPVWLSYMGGTWVSNVGLHTGKSPLKQCDAMHPICRGWTEYELHDEYYLRPTIDKATPLLQVMVSDRPVVVGWVYERPDGGRAFATTLGHYYRNFQQEEFRKMIVNGILWSAKLPIPVDGADVSLSVDELALPKR